MKNRSVFIILLCSILAIAAAFVLKEVKEKKDDEGVSKALVSKQIALLLASKEECEKAGKEYFSENEQRGWFVPFASYLYQKEYLDIQLTPANNETFGKELTKAEACLLLEKLGLSEKLEGKDWFNSQWKNEEGGEKIVKEQWEEMYQWMLEKYNQQNQIVTEEVYLYGTPGTMSEMEAWNAYTSAGVYRFEGLSLDNYIDCKIRIMRKDNDILQAELLEEEVVYKNVLLVSWADSELQVFIDGQYRTWEEKEREKVSEYTLADITLKKGKLKKVELKKDTIEGKILSVQENSIEIEGYGQIPVNSEIKIYKTYGELEIQDFNALLTGYSLQKFIVANGEICGAFTERAMDAQSVRVLLSTSNFESLFHQQVELTAETDFTVTHGGTQENFQAGEKLSLAMDNNWFAEGRITVTPTNGGEIIFSSFTRSFGEPSYQGTIELERKENGILIINELLLEDYLCRVVPSEMPDDFGLEALKAQAVCARSYAYRQIGSNAYSEWGAHVDDTTRFQVYTNSTEKENTRQAVSGTYGEVLTYQGETISAYYFSTSSGHTTDMSIWGSSSDQYPYLVGKLLANEEENVQNNQSEAVPEQEIQTGIGPVQNNSAAIFDWTIEVQYEQFLLNETIQTLDSTYPWYRWNTSLSLEELTKIINNNLPSYQKNNPDSVLVRQADGNFAVQEISGIGEVKRIEIKQRGTGGIVAELEIEGSEYTILLKKQGAVRALLGSRETVYTRKDGTEAGNLAILPSAYIMFKENLENDQRAGYTIYGGGNGHGVGMSQNGAKTLAAQGKNYREILEYFYTGAEIKSVINNS